MSEFSFTGECIRVSNADQEQVIETAKSCLTDAGPSAIAKLLDEGNSESANQKLRECFAVRTDRNLMLAQRSGTVINEETSARVGLKTFIDLAENVSAKETKGIGCDISVVYGKDGKFIGTDLNCTQEISPLVSQIRTDLRLGSVLSEHFNAIDCAGKNNGRITEKEVTRYACQLPEGQLKRDLMEAATRIKHFEKSANDETFKENSGASQTDLYKMQRGLTTLYERALISQKALDQIKRIDTNANGRIDTAEMRSFNAEHPSNSSVTQRVGALMDHVRLYEKGAVPLGEIIAKEMKALKKQYNAVY